MLVVHRQDGGTPQSAGQQKNWVLEFCDGSHARRAISLNTYCAATEAVDLQCLKWLRAGETLIRPGPLLLLLKKGVHYAFDEYCHRCLRVCSTYGRRDAGRCGHLVMPGSSIRLWGTRSTSNVQVRVFSQSREVSGRTQDFAIQGRFQVVSAQLRRGSQPSP